MDNSNKTNEFKCFVEFNDTEYTVIIDNCSEEWIKLNAINSKISQIIGSEISLNTHSFEVLYETTKRVINKKFKRKIRNGSRIRVLNTNHNNSNALNTTNNSIAIRLDNKHELKDSLMNKSIKLKPKQQIQEMNYRFLESVDKSTVDSTIDWTVVSQQMQSFGYNQFNENESKELMNELTEKYIKILVENQKIGLAKNYWKLFDILNTMDLKPIIGAEKYNFVSDLRVELLINTEKIQNKSSAKQKSKQKALNVIQDSNKGQTLGKQSFGQKLGKVFNTNVDNNSQQISGKTELSPQNSGPNKVNKRNSRRSSDNSIKTDLHSNLHKSHTKIKKKEKLDSNAVNNSKPINSITHRNESYIEGIDPKVKQRFRPNYEINKNRFKCFVEVFDNKYNFVCDNCNNGSKLREIITTGLQQRSGLFISHMNAYATHLFEIFDEKTQSFKKHSFKKSEHISDKNIRIRVSINPGLEELTKENKVLIETIKQLTTESKFDWNSVSQMMTSFGFKSLNGIELKRHFRQLVLIYIRVLRISNNKFIANKFWPLFSVFHSLDLKQLCKPKTFTKISTGRLLIEGPEGRVIDHKKIETNNNNNNKQKRGQLFNKRKEETNNNNNNNNNQQKKDQMFNKRKEKPKFEKIPINYKELEPNRRYHFYRMCFDKNFQQLIKTGFIDEISLRKELINCSTIEEQINVFRNKVLLSDEDLKKRNELKSIFETILIESGIECVLHFFGSTANCVGFCNSDIDLFIEIKELNNCFVKIDYNKAMSYLTLIRNILKKTLNFFIPNPIASLRCPIIKADFKFFSEKLANSPRNSKELCKSFEKFGISCDINITNGLGLQNSRLIRLFCEIEPRFQELAIILRFWSKSNGFIGGGDNAMTSYAFTQLVIFFCQNLIPPLLPTVHQLRQLTNESLIIDGWECSFCDDKTLIPKSQNTESVFELLPEFFKFYSNFDFTTQVIQLKNGLAVHKYLFNNQIKTTLNTKDTDVLHFKMTANCCIEDPFNLEHNLTANLSFNVFDKFLEYIKQIALKSDIIFSSVPTKESANEWGISTIVKDYNPTDNYKITVGRGLCLPNPELCVKSADISAKDVIKMFVNQVLPSFPKLLETVYKIESKLKAKWDIVFGQFSPFAEFELDLKAIDLQIIDRNQRDFIRSELKDSLDQNNRYNKEKAITEELIKRFADKQLPNLSFKCQLLLYCYARPSGPYIDYEIIDTKGEKKFINNFLNTVIELIPKMIDEDYNKALI